MEWIEVSSSIYRPECRSLPPVLGEAWAAYLVSSPPVCTPRQPEDLLGASIDFVVLDSDDDPRLRIAADTRLALSANISSTPEVYPQRTRIRRLEAVLDEKRFLAPPSKVALAPQKYRDLTPVLACATKAPGA